MDAPGGRPDRRPSPGIARTATDLLLGVGYGFDKGNTLNTTVRANASGQGGAEFRMNWLYTFR